jgi:hypothetical protein
MGCPRKLSILQRIKRASNPPRGWFEAKINLPEEGMFSLPFIV